MERCCSRPRAPLVAAEIRHVGGGALAGVAPDGDAFGHRDLVFVMQLDAFAGSAQEAEEIKRYLREETEPLVLATLDIRSENHHLKNGISSMH
jgi:hypothetical protein